MHCRNYMYSKFGEMWSVVFETREQTDRQMRCWQYFELTYWARSITVQHSSD